MSAKDTGGSAFPVLENVAPNPDWQTDYGMTLRDYFAARAPAVPQAWFVPTMPTACPQSQWRAVHEKTFYVDVHSAIKACGEDGCFDENAEAIKAWCAETKKQRYVQWPYAWADAQMMERKR